jgi:DNA-directed RNA polymerase II subunit RPB1
MDTSIQLYQGNVKEIDRIELGVLSAEEIESRSALDENSVGIETPELYEKNEPKKGGLNDPRMGTSDSSVDCATCGFESTYCPGHTGHIKLAEPVFHVGFLSHFKTFLGLFCLRCSKLLINTKTEEIKNILKNKKGSARVSALFKMADKVKYCNKDGLGCGTPVPKVRIEVNKSKQEINVVAEYDMDEKEENSEKAKKRTHNLTAREIYDIFYNISNEDVDLIGYESKKSRPESFIISTLLVPAITVRTSAKGDFLGGKLVEDDITHFLASIVKANNKAIKQKEATGPNVSKYLKTHVQFLQIKVASMLNIKSISNTNLVNGKQVKSLMPRLGGKEGHIRNNLMGKRGDFSARTVITPDPNIDFDQIGVPLYIAKKVSYPEIVGTHNYEELTRLCKNGPKNYPGANFVIPMSINKKINKSNQKILRIDLRYRKEPVKLQYGDIVERHLQTGDSVLLNRMPTLHKVSMMRHRVKVVNDPNLLTFRLALSPTEAYNADFDGDEMNILIPQSEKAKIELIRLAAVPLLLINSKDSKPIIGIKQDGLIGAFNITRDEMIINWRNAMNIIGNSGYLATDIKKNQTISGRKLFSYIIPNRINKDSSSITIKKGNIVKGQLSKKWLGNGQENNLVQLIMDEYGKNETSVFINGSEKIANHINLYTGFTVGYGDILIGDKIKNEIEKFISTQELKLENIITDGENNPDIKDVELVNKQIFYELNLVKEEASKLIMNNINKFNNIYTMIKSGSKGKDVNMGHISGCIGLRTFKGFMMEKVLNRRTSAYHFKDDDRPDARGFTKNSLYEGLTYPHFVFNCMSGREGLIQQKLSTAETGYAQRRIVKFMEDVKINANGTVRAFDTISPQLIYGDMGVDTTRQSLYKIDLIEYDNKEIYDKFSFSNTDLKKFTNYSINHNNEHIKEIIKMRDIVRYSVSRASGSYLTLKNEFMIPVNLGRIIDNNVDKDSKQKSDLSPNYILKRLNELLSNEETSLIKMSNNERNDKNYSIKRNDEQTAKTIFKLAIYNALSPKICIEKYKLKKETFEKMISEISRNFKKNMVEPGEMVGVLCGQSLGEPITQMALNSIHSPGTTTIEPETEGVARIKELLSASKNIKTPRVSVYFDKNHRNDENYIHSFETNIKYTKISDITNRIDVYFENDTSGDNTLAKQDNIRKTFYPKEKKLLINLPWVVRIELDREKMLDKEVGILDIVSKFSNWWEKPFSQKNINADEEKLLRKIPTISVSSTFDNDPLPIIHIRFNAKDIESDKKAVDYFNMETVSLFVNNIIEQFKLKGIEGINVVESFNQKLVDFDNNGKVIKSDEKVLKIHGTPIEQIQYMRGVDLNRIISNDIVAMYNKYGIEIARALIIREVDKSFSGEVNYQHIELLIDMMTFFGELVSVDRNGFDAIVPPPLSAASFEKTSDHFTNGAAYGRDDKLKGVSAQIMTGSLINGGTGSIDTMLDIDKIINSELTNFDKKNIPKSIETSKVTEDITTGENAEEDIFIPF